MFAIKNSGIVLEWGERKEKVERIISFVHDCYTT
jgi:hypothetical protein